ncbi:MAG: hypothetical protein LAT55_11395 [Opitutales bacterium]|nr:hypothetical protein [Opitutales bacterium]
MQKTLPTALPREQSSVPAPLSQMAKLEKDAAATANLVLHLLEEISPKLLCQTLAAKAKNKFPHLPALFHEFNAATDKSTQQQLLREIRHFLFELAHLLELLFQRQLLDHRDYETIAASLIAFSTIVLQLEMRY